MIKAAINGFGRIGRVTFRNALLHYRDEINIVAINNPGSMDAAGWAHMVRYDSVYGHFGKEIKVENKGQNEDEIGALVIDGVRYPILAQKEPAKIPWKNYGVEVVLEASGVFRSEEGAKGHLEAGAKKVIISAPEQGGNVGTFLIGVNQEKYTGQYDVISNASCTTNCVAPVVKVMIANFGIKKGFLTTIHSYTSSQNLTDGSGKDLRRARAAAVNIIPTTTGATIATAKAIPELTGIFDGLAMRVPVLNGSISDFTFLTDKETTVEEINEVFQKAAGDPHWQNILAVTDEPIVSSDIIGRSESAIVDLSFTRVVGGDLVKILAWYDNEWGYASRLIEQAIAVGRQL
ncbi:type I glyceraldehyde-3-phosphate dehydrogenase [Candidatus Microgenomates bacterium]|nr:type I glyceraldehyde-3-phosphate dehydrogenase [Candidatus Microgenomates bacterium]